jgi:hypothetical protein
LRDLTYLPGGLFIIFELDRHWVRRLIDTSIIVSVVDTLECISLGFAIYKNQFPLRMNTEVQHTRYERMNERFTYLLGQIAGPLCLIGDNITVLSDRTRRCGPEGIGLALNIEDATTSFLLEWLTSNRRW